MADRIRELRGVFGRGFVLIELCGGPADGEIVPFPRAMLHRVAAPDGGLQLIHPPSYPGAPYQAVYRGPEQVRDGDGPEGGPRLVLGHAGWI